MNVSFNQVWARIVALQGQTFVTVARRLPFTYAVEHESVWVIRDGRRINQQLHRNNFEQVYDMMLGPNPPRKVSDINVIAKQRGQSQVRGPAFVWAILQDHRVAS